MSYFYAVFMGILQGLTEFLPVSSSGHLVLLQHIFGLDEVGLGFNIVLHIGTLVAVFIYYRKDLFSMLKEFFVLMKEMIHNKGRIDIHSNEHRLLLVMLVLATIPTAVIGLLLNATFESLFQSWYVVGYTLIITGVLLWITNYLPVGVKQAADIRIRDVLLIGIVQGAAITPGISRSGSTIFAALVSGFTKDLATRFSFLLSIPAILAAVVLEAPEIIHELSTIGNLGSVFLGFLAAALSGYLAIDLLIKIIRRQKLQYFSYYCWSIGSITLLYHWIFS